MSKLQKIIEDIKNKIITKLNLHGNEIGDQGTKAIAEALRDNYAITKFDLSHNRIGAEGAKALADAFKDNYAITELNLSGNEIGDEGVKALAKALKDNYAITELTLFFNAINDEKATEKISNIIKRNIECQKNTIKFLNDNFVEKNDKIIINLLNNIKNFKIFQNINENILKREINKDNWSSINKAKLYVQDNWFEAFGVCINFKPKDADKYSLFTHLPPELKNHIVSFLGSKSLWQYTKLPVPTIILKSTEEITDNSVKTHTDENKAIHDSITNNDILELIGQNNSDQTSS